MPRCNGSYIGIAVNPNANAASGIWTVREAEAYLRSDQWPTAPTVPGAPTGTAGDEQVALTWTAPTGGSTPTDYEVQYSSDGGASWTTFSDGVSTDTSATVTGLTGGTGYIFRVRAVSNLGEGPYGSASGTVTPFAGTALLLHFDGSNGSTTFTDSSPNALTVTANGDAQLSTTEKKFGSASGSFDGNGDYLSIPGGAWRDVGDGDFTLECWIYLPSGSGGRQYIFGPGTDTPTHLDGFGLEVDNTTLYMWASSNGDGWDIVTSDSSEGRSTEPIPVGEWVHVAMTRTSGTFRSFVNGVMGCTVTGKAAAIFYDNTVPYNVGRSGHLDGTFFFNGYIDELRLVKGTSLYDSDDSFTPPTGPF